MIQVKTSIDIGQNAPFWYGSLPKPSWLLMITPWPTCRSERLTGESPQFREMFLQSKKKLAVSYLFLNHVAALLGLKRPFLKRHFSGRGLVSLADNSTLETGSIALRISVEDYVEHVPAGLEARGRLVSTKPLVYIEHELSEQVSTCLPNVPHVQGWRSPVEDELVSLGLATTCSILGEVKFGAFNLHLLAVIAALKTI